MGGCSAARVISQADVARRPTELSAEITPKNTPGMKRPRGGWARRRTATVGESAFIRMSEVMSEVMSDTERDPQFDVFVRSGDDRRAMADDEHGVAFVGESAESAE